MKTLEVIETIARERCIDQQTVMEVMENILLEHAISKYGHSDILKAKLFEDGSFEIFLEQEVVQIKTDNDFSQISLEKALKRDPDAKLGSIIKEVLPLSVGKADIEKIFLTLRSQLNNAQKTKEYDLFHPKIGQLLTGYIKRADAAEAIISFSDGEGVLKKNDMLPADTLRAGSYIKVYIKDVKRAPGRQIFLSRSHEGFLRELMKMEIPEIQEGLVEIKSIARDVGSLAKVAVYSNRSSINPVSVCIGAYGSRIQAVIKELLGEKISVIEWNENLHQFLANAMAPAIVSKVIEKNNKRYEIVTSQDQFSKAMGRGGQNVILAKRLCKVTSIKLLTEEEETRIYKELMQKQVSSLMDNLEIEEMMAHLLVSEKFDYIEKIALSSIEELAKLNGFDEELAQALQERAKDFINDEIIKTKETLSSMNKDISIFDLMPILSLEHIKEMISQNVFEKSDVAMLDADEVKELFENTNDLAISFEKAREIIAYARNIQIKQEQIND